MNELKLMGFINKEMELQKTKNNYSYMNFSLMVPKILSAEAKKNIQEKGGYLYDFFNITAFGKTAEYIYNYAKVKGKIIVDGRLNQSVYKNKDGTNSFKLDIICDKVTILDFKQEKVQDNSKNFENNFENDFDRLANYAEEFEAMLPY